MILGIVGAVAGGFIAGPGGAVKGALLGWSVGTSIGSIIDTSRQHIYTSDLGRTSDLRVTVASYGTSIPQLFGLCKVPGIITWGTDLVEHEQDHNSGGGSGGPKVTTRVYSYTVSFAMVICKGNSANRIKKIEGNDLVLYDSTQSGNVHTPIYDSFSTEVGQSVTPAAYPNFTFRYYYGTETQNADPLIISSASNTDISSGSDNPAFRGTMYLVVQDMVLTDLGNTIPNISVTIDGGTTYVSDVITYVLDQVGIDTSTELDVSLVNTIPITGLTLGSRIDVKSALQPILDAYSIDLIDVDGKIKAVPRGGSIVATITWDDLGAVSVGSGTAPSVQRIVKTRTEDLSLPKRIDVGYFSPTIDLQNATQGAIRQSARHNNYVSLSYPLTLHDDEARQLAERILYLEWIEREKYDISAMPYFSNLCASDCALVQINDAGDTQRARIISAEIGLPGEVKLSLVKDDDSTYTQTVLAATPTGVVVSTLPIDTNFFAFSGIELQNTDSMSAGIYIAATGEEGWQGASILVSVDSGASYQNVGSVGARSVFGTVTTTLGSTYTPDGNGFDVTNTFNVTTNGSLSSTNETDVLSGYGNYGLVLYGNTSVHTPTDYEIVGFADATLTSTNHYTIGTLLRAQRGTPATGHGSTDKFVELSTSLQRIVVALNLVGTVIKVKCVSPGIDIATVTAQDVYICPPTNIYPTSSSVSTAISTAIAAIPPTTVPVVPQWRVKGYLGNSNGVFSGTSIDQTYFTGVNVPSGVSIRNFNYTANDRDSSIMWQTTLPFALWFKIKVHNTTGGSVNLNYWIPYIDDGMAIYVNNTLVYQSFSATDITGSLAILTGDNIVDVLFYNKYSAASEDDDQNPGPFNFIVTTDTVAAGFLFSDPGAF